MVTIPRPEEHYFVEVEDGVIVAEAQKGSSVEMTVEEAQAVLDGTEGAKVGEPIQTRDDGLTAVVSSYMEGSIDLHVVGDEHPEPIMPVTHKVTVERDVIEEAIKMAG